MKSRRNKIQRHGNTVIKTFVFGNFDRELLIYQCLNEAHVDHASIIDVRGDELVLEYLNGIDLLTLFLKYEQSQISFVHMLNLWFEYMQAFYKATKHYRHGDVHLGNFIFVNEKVIGLDFEQAQQEDPIKDVSDLVCYILFYHPVLTKYKMETIKEWINHHPWIDKYHQKQWIDELNASLDRLNSRRETNYVMDWMFLFEF